MVLLSCLQRRVEWFGTVLIFYLLIDFDKGFSNAKDWCG